MKIQYISDIHLELMPEGTSWTEFFESILEPQCWILVLAGDIGSPFDPSYEALLHWTSEHFLHIIIVLGNHEYYSDFHFSEVQQQARKVVSGYPKVHLLEKQTLELNGVTFVGTTLWSPCTDWYLNDFYSIWTDKGKLLKPKNMEALHQESKQWLEELLPRLTGKVVVITHHLPTQKLIGPQYLNCDNTGFVSDLDHLFEYVDIWICGHSHRSVNLIEGRTHLGMNCLGYSEETIEKFQKVALIEI